MSTNTESGATRADSTTITDHGSSRTGIGDGDHGWARPVATDTRHDRIRWGAVWTGALTTLTIYLALQLLFFALGWLDLGNEGSGTTRAVVSGVLGLIAFFLGGAAAGASALWHRANDGMVNGVVAWAVTVVAVLAFALVGGGALLGSLADAATQFVDLSTAGAGVDVAEATETARRSAGWAALGLGLTMLAGALGGSVGAKLWPGRGERDANRR
ncbi:MAG TPA: hypothetical protein VD813_12985 [Pseudonocardia sp.]|nr:hypothetical protein [Pseudonocardia sp.]